ncbi:lactate utilization protein C [Lutibacter sp.]|uniref:LutC/YkgG family protein n=1 Tax=Lutibacter sp. TaxID=1925666 RepID=UPI0035686242
MGKSSILKSIKENKPTLISLPEIDINSFEEAINLLETFKKNVESVGGSIKELGQIQDLDLEIKNRYPNAKRIFSQISESVLGNVQISEQTKPHDLENLDLAILKGEFGVAENGAIWISDAQFSIRILPFITNDLALILQKKDLCLHMHDAYKIIANRTRTFGLFISGPSKTADIEQCLVIGAQGAMSLTIFLV